MQSVALCAVYMFLVQLILVCGGLIGEGFASNDMSLVSDRIVVCVFSDDYGNQTCYDVCDVTYFHAFLALPMTNMQIVTGYMTSILMTFVMLSILNMYDVLSAKALSNLPTTTFMHEEEVSC